jgi:hypothetical protein
MSKKRILILMEVAEVGSSKSLENSGASKWGNSSMLSASANLKNNMKTVRKKFSKTFHEKFDDAGKDAAIKYLKCRYSQSDINIVHNPDKYIIPL